MQLFSWKGPSLASLLAKPLAGAVFKRTAFTETSRQRVGPYEMVIALQPAKRHGRLNFRLSVLDASTLHPAKHASVELEIVHPDGWYIDYHFEPAGDEIPLFYESSAQVPARSSLTFEVTVLNPLGLQYTGASLIITGRARKRAGASNAVVAPVPTV